MTPSDTPPATAKALRASDLMSSEPFTVDYRARVIDAAELMLAHGVSNAPVVGMDPTRRKLSGFISEKDVMQCYASGRLYSQPGLQVGEIMRIHPIAVRPEADLFNLAAIFMQHGFRHLPVVAAGTGVLEGVVSRRDVLAGLLAHYAEWQREDPLTRRVPDVSGLFAPRYLLG